MRVDETPSKARIAVVVPVFEDAVAATMLFKELKRLFGTQLFIVAVDDGSVQFPLNAQVLRELSISGVVLRLRRNVGHQKAIAIGICYISESLPMAPLVVVMDSDGEDVPETIQDLISAVAADDVDVAVAQRKSRVESLGFKVFYALFKRLFHLLSGRQISFGNFMALKPSAVKRMAAMQELWTHVASCLLMSKLRVARCSVARGPRYAGRSKMNFVGLVLHGLKAMMVFAEDVLVRVGIFCALVVGLSVLGIGLVVLLKAIGLASPGWFSVALGILVIVLLQGGGLALMTLMSLMLSGGLRGGAVSSSAYQDYVDTIDSTEDSWTR